MIKYYYEVDKFIEFESVKSIIQCNIIIPKANKSRYTRIENIDGISYFLENLSKIPHKVISKEEYYNSPQIKGQLLIKALKELK